MPNTKYNSPKIANNVNFFLSVIIFAKSGRNGSECDKQNYEGDKVTPTTPFRREFHLDVDKGLMKGGVGFKIDDGKIIFKGFKSHFVCLERELSQKADNVT